MEKFECSICNIAFDDTIRRPRSLPCGHGFCTLCIDESITRGNKYCYVCREEHGANSAAEIPVNFLLEELLHKASTVSASQKPKSDSSFEMGIAGMCPNHDGIPLYFHCKSHNIKVCVSCMAIDHPPISCNLISLEGEIKERKQSQIEIVQNKKQDLMDAEKDFEILLKRGSDYLSEKNKKKQELEKEVELLRIKIEQVKNEMVNKEKFQTQIKHTIQGCQNKQKCFVTMENKLKDAISNQDIVKQCKVTETEILKIQKWEDSKRKTLNMMKVSEEENKYAQVIRNGIQRSCKIFSEVGRTFIPSLTKDLKPPSSAIIINEADIGLTSATTIVFMDLSGNGHYLGRIYLRIFSDKHHGQQFLMLALGTTGATFKGATFDQLHTFPIVIKEYVTERGMLSNNLLIKPMKENENPGKILRGRLFIKFMLTTLSFQIETTSFPNSPEEWGYFGDVISGMDIIDRAVSEYGKVQVASSSINLSDITISECGIVLNY